MPEFVAPMVDASPDDLLFRRLRAMDLIELEPQESQRTQYGLRVADMGLDEAEDYAAGPYAWAAVRGERVLACMGVAETFPGAAGVAWALFAEGPGEDHLAITRFARDEVIGKCPLPRIEAVVRCVDIEPLAKGIHDLNPHQMLARAMRAEHRTPQVRWALAVGLMPIAVLRKYGAASETHMLLERVL